MSNHLITSTCLLFCLLLVSAAITAQDSRTPTIISPYDSISIERVQVTAKTSSATVAISLVIRNNYHRVAQLSFGSGAFSDFGMTDDKGTRYQLYHSERLQSSQVTNQGFARISNLQFGENKLGMINLVHDTLAAGTAKILILQLEKVDKTIHTIQEAHLLATLQLNYRIQGQKLFQLKNIPIAWDHPTSLPNAQQR